MLIRLPDPQIIELAGDDALAFAQAQFTSDSTTLAAGTWQWSAWLSAQGRVRSFFQLLRVADDRFYLLLRGGSAARLRDALARYVMRAKLTLRVVSDMQLFSTGSAHDIEERLPVPDGTRIVAGNACMAVALPGKAPRWLLLAPQTLAFVADDSPVARNTHALADMDAGLAVLDEALEDKLLPDWLGLGDLGAISVRKGCYPGQEVVARLHFKGGNKRWLHRIEFAATQLPQPGASLPADSENAALVICAAWRLPSESAATSSGNACALVAMRDGVDARQISDDAAGIDVLDIQRARITPVPM
jgi:tRNA-modifying protein YgfZ